MNTLTKLWNFLDGKKSAIAVAYGVIAPDIMTIWFPDGAPDLVSKTVATVGVILAVVGVGHKLVKGK